MRKSLCLLVITMLLTWMTTPANALSIRLSDGGANTVTIDDNAAGDANSTLGAVTYIGPVGAFTTNVATGLSYPVPGTNAVTDLPLPLLSHAGHGSHSHRLVSYFHASLNPVPQPRTFLLLGVGLLGVGMYGRHRNQR